MPSDKAEEKAREWYISGTSSNVMEDIESLAALLRTHAEAAYWEGMLQERRNAAQRIKTFCSDPDSIDGKGMSGGSSR